MTVHPPVAEIGRQILNGLGAALAIIVAARLYLLWNTGKRRRK